MNKLEQKQKEVRAVEAELRAARLKQHNLKDDIRKKGVELDRITSDVEDTRASLAEELDKKNVLDKENKLVREDTEMLSRKIAQEKTAINKRYLELSKANDQNIANREAYDKDVVNLVANERVCKKKEANIKKDREELEQRISSFEIKISDIEYEKQAELEKAKKKPALFDKKMQELESQVDRALQAEKLFTQKQEKYSKLTTETEQIKHSYITARTTAETEKNNLVKAIHQSEKDQEEAKNVQLSFERQLKTLNVKDNEIKIKDLRVKRIIKEKGIANELKKLEEEASK